MSITLEQYQNKLSQLAKEGSEKAIESIVVPAANELLANIKNRIIKDGQKSDGSKIGNYSVKPIYVEREAFIQKSKFKPKGKTGKTTFDNGRPHKSMYLQQGYKELRSIQGRPVDKINEFYSGSTMASYQMEVQSNQVLLGITNEKSAKIRAGQEKRFGKIFSATRQEIEDYNKEVVKGNKDLVSRIFNG